MFNRGEDGWLNLSNVNLQILCVHKNENEGGENGLELFQGSFAWDNEGISSPHPTKSPWR